jgi:hypothetical protein
MVFLSATRASDRFIDLGIDRDRERTNVAHKIAGGIDRALHEPKLAYKMNAVMRRFRNEPAGFPVSVKASHAL